MIDGQITVFTDAAFGIIHLDVHRAFERVPVPYGFATSPAEFLGEVQGLPYEDSSEGDRFSDAGVSTDTPFSSSWEEDFSGSESECSEFQDYFEDDDLEFHDCPESVGDMVNYVGVTRARVATVSEGSEETDGEAYVLIDSCAAVNVKERVEPGLEPAAVLGVGKSEVLYIDVSIC